jgi:hypothetical protein
LEFPFEQILKCGDKSEKSCYVEGRVISLEFHILHNTLRKKRNLFNGA